MSLAALFESAKRRVEGFIELTLGDMELGHVSEKKCFFDGSSTLIPSDLLPLPSDRQLSVAR